MSINESNRPPLEEAQTEAKEISELTGRDNTTEGYTQAHNTLITKQTKEKLENKDWLQTLKFTVTIMDHIKKVKNDQTIIENKISRDQDTAERQQGWFEESTLNQQLLTETMKKIEDGKNTLDIKLLSIFFMILLENEDLKNIDIKGGIIDRMYAAKKDNSQKISLSPEELIFVEKFIPELLEGAENRITTLSDNLDASKKEHKEDSNKKLSLDQELENSEIILETAIKALDKHEEEKGAPPYPENTEATELQHQAYEKRIEWRKEQTKAIGYRDLPRGKEISRKWAFYAEINGQHLLLNKDQSYDDVRPLLILTNRIPAKTLAIYSEGMMMERRDSVSLQAVISNGNIELSDQEMREQYKNKLDANTENLKSQLR